MKKIRAAINGYDLSLTSVEWAELCFDPYAPLDWRVIFFEIAESAGIVFS